MRRIYLLLPTRNRPVDLQASIDSAFRFADIPERVLPLLAVDDDDANDYSDYRFVRRSPRFGYKNLHRYMNELAKQARELDRDGGLEPGYQILWNDDERMLTQGWDTRLLAYGFEPKVVFMRSDRSDPVDTAYPAWPGELFDLFGCVATCNACDLWLAQVTGVADRLLLANSTHVYAPDIFVRHERSESDQTAIERRNDYSTPEPVGHLDFLHYGAKLALARDAGQPGWVWSPPFGCDPPGHPRKAP